MERPEGSGGGVKTGRLRARLRHHFATVLALLDNIDSIHAPSVTGRMYRANLRRDPGIQHVGGSA